VDTIGTLHPCGVSPSMSASTASMSR
jgi:hypothetical protein